MKRNASSQGIATGQVLMVLQSKHCLIMKMVSMVAEDYIDPGEPRPFAAVCFGILQLMQFESATLTWSALPRHAQSDCGARSAHSHLDDVPSVPD